MILTEVPCVYRRYRKSNQEAVRELSAAEAEELLPELPEGSMRPKLEAAVAFARAGGETLITSSDSLGRSARGPGRYHDPPITHQRVTQLSVITVTLRP